MQIWRLWHSASGYEVELTEVPWWALVASRAVEVIDGATGHRFCGAGAPNWLWRVPVGRPVYDETPEGEERFLVNSLAGALSDVFNRVACLDISRARTLHRFPVSAELAATLGAESWDGQDESDGDVEV